MKHHISLLVISSLLLRFLRKQLSGNTEGLKIRNSLSAKEMYENLSNIFTGNALNVLLSISLISSQSF